MAVTGVNNYSNIYTNAYTGNIRKNNAKETTEKQVVEQTEDVKTWTTRKTAADELSYLSKKFDNYSFVSANYSPGMKYGKSTTTNVAISPQFLTKMANDSDLEDEYIKEIGNMKKLDEQFAKQQADIGWRVEQGWAIDKDGNISSWAIGHKDSKVKSFLQNMSEKAEEIQQKQLEKAKETMDIYAPIAQRLGISKIKVELDDLSLMYLQPDVYHKLEHDLTLGKEARENFVKEIVAECGTTRQTFYRNFQDKYDLINWYFDRILLESFQHMGEGKTAYEGLVNKFHYIEEEKLFFKAAFRNDDQNCLRDHDFQLICAFYTEQLETRMACRLCLLYTSPSPRDS